MKDFFKEQLVPREVNSKDKNKRIFILVAAALIILLLWEIINSVAALNPDYYYSLMLLIIVFAALTIFGAIRLINSINREYEYCYTEGNLDIDVILNKSRRKRVFSGYAEEFEVLASVYDGQHLAMYDSLKTKDFSSGRIKDNTYVFVAVYKGKKRKFIVEPCNEILQALRIDMTPRRAFIKNNIFK